MAQVSSITAAIQAAGITPTGMIDLLLRASTAEASNEAKARVKVILDGLCNLPLTEGRALLKETAKTAKGTPNEKVIRVRVSECRSLYGAVKLLPDFRAKAESAGWHNAVGQAREALEAANLKPDGGQITTPEQRAAKQEQNAMFEILAENMVGVDTRDESKVAEIVRESAETARNVLAQKAVLAHADRLCKAYSPEYITALIDAMMNWAPKQGE